MLAKILNSKLLIALTIFAFFSACEKNDLVDQQADLLGLSELELRDGNTYGTTGNGQCAELVFPVTVDFPDGTSAEAADEAALHDLLDEWKTNNPGSTERPLIAYPHNVMLADGSVVTINNKEELQAIFAACMPAGGHGKGKGRGHGQGGPEGRGQGPRGGDHGAQHCFTPVFPLNVVFPDGSVEAVADATAFETLLHTWRDNNPDATGRPEIELPFEVELADGTLVMVETEEDLIAIKQSCRKIEPCFELVYPVSFLLPTGETVDVTTHEEQHEVLRTWRLNNPGVEGRPELIFPVTIVYSDGTQAEIVDEAALHAAKETCRDGE